PGCGAEHDPGGDPVHSDAEAAGADARLEGALAALGLADDDPAPVHEERDAADLAAADDRVERLVDTAARTRQAGTAARRRLLLGREHLLLRRGRLDRGLDEVDHGRVLVLDGARGAADLVLAGDVHRVGQRVGVARGDLVRARVAPLLVRLQEVVRVAGQLLRARDRTRVTARVAERHRQAGVTR